MRFLPFIIIGGAVVAAIFLVANSRFQNENPIQDANGGISVLQKNFESQTNNEGAVTVMVLPKTVSESGWEFEITLDTHSGALNEDMTAVAVLVDGAGKEHAPLAWEGDSAGGHHRAGILKFKALAQKPEMIKLVIRGIGDIPERVFTWRVLP